MSWKQILKQPSLSMGNVGLIDLSNVPEEEEKCRPKYERWVKKIIKYFF